MEKILFKGVVSGLVTKKFSSKDGLSNQQIVDEAIAEAKLLYDKSVGALDKGFEKFEDNWEFWDADEHRDKVITLAQEIFGEPGNGRLPGISHYSQEKSGGIYQARYPFIALLPIYLSKSESETITGNAATYSAIEITKPSIQEKYFSDGLLRTLEACGEHSDREIYVGLSTTPIPLPFAVDTSKIQKIITKKFNEKFSSQTDKNPLAEHKFSSQLTNDLRECFPMPNLLDIDDRFVSGSYKTKTLQRKNYNFFPSIITEKIDEICKAYYRSIKHAEEEKIKWEQKDERDIDDFSDCESCEYDIKEAYKPLTFFSGLRYDYSVGRLNHYSGTNYSDFQEYVIFTNYSDYVPHFIQYIIDNYISKGKGTLVLPKPTRNGIKRVFKSEGLERKGLLYKEELTTQEKKNRIKKIEGIARKSECQMPAYHFKPDADCDMPGITLVNIGVGPSNAKNMCDHIAVLRSKCWLMLGHCAGIRRTQDIGQYVLANGYKRDDHCMDRFMAPNVSIPDLSEIETVLVDAVKQSIWESIGQDEKDKFIKIAGLPKSAKKHDKIWNNTKFQHADSQWTKLVKKRLRIGRVITTDDRNWELMSFDEIINWMEDTRAVAVDMESATIAACGYRYRIPYGTLLCVSDKPLYGEIKLEGMAAEFYKTATQHHLEIALDAFVNLNKNAEGLKKMRKLIGVDDPVIC